MRDCPSAAGAELKLRGLEMPEEKKEEMGVGCVAVARERPTTRDGVVVATTALL
jgi:hypothetical protein